MGAKNSLALNLFPPKDETFSNTISPLTDILLESEKRFLYSQNELIFCYKAAIQMLESCIEGTYTNFDALTTTTCCHGLSIFAHGLILQALKFDLNHLLRECYEKHNATLQLHNTERYPCDWYLPKPLIDLTRLYLLSHIKEHDPVRIWRTSVSKLKEIAPIGTKFCTNLTYRLQNYYSNKIAGIYHEYYKSLDKDMLICEVPLSLWAKYTHPSIIRVDKRGRKYAPCMFSMQISLAYLIANGYKIALINDLRSTNGKMQSRYMQIFEGDTFSNFEIVSSIEILNAKSVENEPVIVFSGCAYSDDTSKGSLHNKMHQWVNFLPQLILACDIHYPHFPFVRDDPNFDFSKIIPAEELLQKTIDKYSATNGVSAHNPSLFCLTHIYPASLKQIARTLINTSNSELPYSFIATQARTKAFAHSVDQ